MITNEIFQGVITKRSKSDSFERQITVHSDEVKSFDDNNCFVCLVALS
jgi:hypothetical protein